MYQTVRLFAISTRSGGSWQGRWQIGHGTAILTGNGKAVVDALGRLSGMAVKECEVEVEDEVAGDGQERHHMHA